MEEWNTGMLEYWEKLLKTQHSTTPLFHNSKWGEAPKFYNIVSLPNLLNICNPLNQINCSIKFLGICNPSINYGIVAGVRKNGCI
jgi:hypothetical protein